MTVEQVVPILNVTDVEASVAWFGKLGWNKGFDWRGAPGGPVDFGAVTAGDHEIFLCRDGQGGRGRGQNRSTRAPRAAGNSAWSEWTVHQGVFWNGCPSCANRCGIPTVPGGTRPFT